MATLFRVGCRLLRPLCGASAARGGLPALGGLAGARSVSQTPPLLAASEADLGRAKERLSVLTEDPGNDVKLRMYALFKQVGSACMLSTVEISFVDCIPPSTSTSQPTDNRYSLVCAQATIGPCNKTKPGAFDFVGRAKWTAWNDLGDLSTVVIHD